jgi:glycosyltransferase involved in cell wall biosynthesis
MRICFLANAASANTRTWVNYLAGALGHDVHVVSVYDGDGLDPAVTLHALGGGRPGARLAGRVVLMRNVERIGRIVHSIAPDLVVAYRVASYGYVGARLGFHPLAVAAQGAQIVSPPGSLYKRVAAQRAIRAADLLNSWAPHMTRRLVELGADPARVLTCPRGIDLGAFSAGADASERAPAIVSTRALRRSYRIETILEAAALVAREVRDVSVVVAGEGPDEGRLRTLARRLGLGDRVSFPGPIREDAIARLLRESAIYMSACPTDGVSASLLEAMASGAFPIVARNEANGAWVEDGSGGFLVGERAPSAYVAALARALRDSALRRSAASRNRAVVEERGDLDVNMKLIGEAYGRLVAQARRERT